MSAAFAFDAYGTLFDVSAAINLHRNALGADADAIATLWRSKQLEYSWTLTLMDRYEDFWTLTEKALTFALERYPMVDRTMRETLLAAYSTLGAYPDVMSTLTQLHKGGTIISVFTNGTERMVTGAIQAAGLEHLIDSVVSCDRIRTYKTAPAAYAYLCSSLSMEKELVTLVSSNRWDVAGGSAFGLNTVWCNRTKMPNEYLDHAPEAIIKSLHELI